MLVPEISYTLRTVAPDTDLTLQAKDCAQLVFIGEYDAREEVHWVEVIECLQNFIHRARVLQDSAVFHDLPAGEIIYFRPDHIVQLVMGGTSRATA